MIESTWRDVNSVSTESGSDRFVAQVVNLRSVFKSRAQADSLRYKPVATAPDSDSRAFSFAEARL
jgi:hypothetical protein